jgi:hypothetical protein
LVLQLLTFNRENNKYSLGPRGAKMRAERFRRRKSRWLIVGKRMRLLATLALGLAFACFLDWYMSERPHATAPLQSISSGSPGSSTPADPLLISKSLLPLAVHGEPSGRVVYPYSVIPGGIHSIQELKNAIAKDSVVSSHYATFRLANARFIRLDRERSMHVSYRLGDQVYWTKRELKLAKGETLVTDGVQTARTRCGNLIAETVVAPVSPNEPTAQELNTPEDHPETASYLESVDRIPELVPPADSNAPPPDSHVPPPASNAPPALGSSPSGSGTKPRILLPSGPGGPIRSPAVPRLPRVVITPEPGTASLLLTGVLALLFMYKRKPKDAPKIVA